MKTIVIIGGGFAGLEAAKHLRKRMYVKPWGRWLWNVLSVLTFGLLKRQEYDRRFKIVLFSTENHTIFTPLLTEVVGASISPLHVVWPLRQMLPGVECLTAEVTRIQRDHDRIYYRLPDGGEHARKYDQLIIACGSRVNMDLLPGMAARGIPLKTLGDAISLRNHIIGRLEQAEVEIDEEIKKRLLSFVVIGGGFSGVEVAGEMLDLLKGCAKYYPTFGPEDVNVYLLHGRDYLLPELPRPLGEFAYEKLKERGLDVRLETRAQAITATDVRLQDGSTIPADTVVCTIGNAPLTLITSSDLPQDDKGWILTDGTMLVKDTQNVWAMGDCATVPNAVTGERSPGTAQFAVRQAKQLVENIEASMAGGELKPFSYSNRGMFASIGHHTAVGQISFLVSVKLSGLFAWFLWRAFYLSKMPSLARKIQIALDWFWNMFFPPDIVQISLGVTGRLPKAHYEAGQYVFRQGDRADAFYVIEKGLAGVYVDEDERARVLLKPGDHFGERGLMGAGERTASVKAEEPLDVFRIEKGSFEDLIGHFDIFRTRMEGVVKRIGALNALVADSSGSERLNKKEVSEVMITTFCTVTEDDTFEEARRRSEEGQLGAVIVLNDDGRMTGICTRTDLSNAAASGMVGNTPVKQLMNEKPLSVQDCDPLSRAMYIFLKEPIKRLVVVSSEDDRKPVGWITPFEILPFMAESPNGKHAAGEPEPELAAAR